MTTRTKVVATGIILAALIGLSAADSLVNQSHLSAYIPDFVLNGNRTGAPSAGTAKMSGPNVAQAMIDLGFTVERSAELSLIEQIVGEKGKVEGLKILKDGDRAGSITWVESADVKTYFASLKESLLSSFSPNVRGLRDATDTRSGLPVRNILTFTDPGLSEERLTFVRVRERLYEFHIAKEEEDAFDAAIEALTTK
ncbi:hypothetical protein HZA45_00745 [Candidatus Peregrinibacteria bacterium]|nr:hypothetical protein [Candidatus Peregrinibacteria bacterium]